MQKPVPRNPEPSSPKNTLDQYREVIARARKVFSDKGNDYGSSWRVLRLISIVDQIYIKAWRIRQIQENGEQLIADSIESEFIGIINYGYVSLIQIQHKDSTRIDWSLAESLQAYDEQVEEVSRLMLMKNHDYGEAWRAMSLAGLTDLILVKLMRIRQILANDGKTKVSEGPGSNLADIINYAIFASILLDEKGGEGAKEEVKS